MDNKNITTALKLTGLLFIVFYIINVNIRLVDINNSIKDIYTNINSINEFQLRELNYILDLDRKIEDNEDLIKDIFDLSFHSNVIATVYHPVPEQTDDTPNITADGTVFDIDSASDYRYIAVSRDLHRRWGGDFDFNDIVYIKSDSVSGFFVIKDLMNARFEKRIDFLHTPNTPGFKLNNVELYATNIKKAI